MEYDFRSRLHTPLSEVGRSMSWGEAIRLVRIFSGDPSSQLAASLNDLKYPISREAIILADLFDLQHQSKARKKPDPYPRPWPDRKKKVTKIGNTAGLTPVQVADILRSHGHEIAGATHG